MSRSNRISISNQYNLASYLDESPLDHWKDTINLHKNLVHSIIFKITHLVYVVDSLKKNSLEFLKAIGFDKVRTLLESGRDLDLLFDSLAKEDKSYVMTALGATTFQKLISTKENFDIFVSQLDKNEKSIFVKIIGAGYVAKLFEAKSQNSFEPGRARLIRLNSVDHSRMAVTFFVTNEDQGKTKGETPKLHRSKSYNNL